MKRKLLIAAAGLLAVNVGIVVLLTQPVMAGARTGPEVKVDPERLKAVVTKLSVDFAPRDYTHPQNLDSAAEWLRTELAATSPNVTVQEWQVKGVTFRNVSALYGPASAERTVVGAHYDGCEPFPAADDNGSGVAALLELARLLAANPPKAQVELVAWSLEEPPFFRTQSMGSYVHAKSLADAKVKVRGALSLETMGYYRDDEGSQHFPAPGLSLLYSTRANYLAVVGNLGQIGLTRVVKSAMQAAAPLPIFSINAPVAIPGIDFSDHLNYWKFGYPAVMLTDTAFNRNDRYHTANDTADSLDYARLAQATTGVFEAIWRLAQP
jgi:Zn-dependent M28 family amino/carboxypeptidase